MACAESNLFDLREVLVDCPVEDKFPDVVNRYQRFRPDFSSIKDIEIKTVLVFFLDNLNTELPFGIHAILNGFVEVLPVEI